jgi:hypothetical protein
MSDRWRGGISRRRILVAAGAAAGGVLLDGCGSSTGKPAPTSEVNGVDADLLDEVLAIEHMAIAAYAHIAGSLTGGARSLAEKISRQEAAHAARLTPLINDLGGRPTPARRDYGFPALADPDAGLALVGGIENMLVAAYIDVIPKLTNQLAKAAAVTIVTNEAQHLALVTQARGLPPAPEAIVRGAA